MSRVPGSVLAGLSLFYSNCILLSIVEPPRFQLPTNLVSGHRCKVGCVVSVIASMEKNRIKGLVLGLPCFLLAASPVFQGSI